MNLIIRTFNLKMRFPPVSKPQRKNKKTNERKTENLKATEK